MFCFVPAAHKWPWGVFSGGDEFWYYTRRVCVGRCFCFFASFFLFLCYTLKQNEAQTARAESTHEVVKYRPKDVTQTQQQRLESPTVTLIWHASKYKRYIIFVILMTLFLIYVFILNVFYICFFLSLLFFAAFFFFCCLSSCT